MKSFKPKAIALMSGGLDSSLAARLIKDQGVEVIGLHLASPFGCLTDVKRNAEIVGVPLIIKDKGEAYLDLVKNPRFGYGSNMNPCIDCRVFMFEFAQLVLEEQDAQFIVTGEVLGQRPMSQQRTAMNRIDKESGQKGEILRPLSAKRFAPTRAEQEGWVDREKLLGISGRGRRAQLELAKSLGIKEFEAPGGGCLLTDPSFSRRLKDYFEVEQGDGEARIARSGLLRHGRYFRLGEALRVIVGRDQSENQALAKGWKQAKAVYFKPDNFLGPDAVALGEVSEEAKETIGRIITRYSKADMKEKWISFQSEGNAGRFSVTSGLPEDQIREMII